MSFNFAPRGWAQCNGQLLPINQNQALFALLGTTFGGDGRINFALPDLRGRVPIHVGPGYILGQRAGADSHTVSIMEVPSHQHTMVATTSSATTSSPSTSVVLAKSVGADLYGVAGNPVALAADALTNVGGSQPHENRQPFLRLQFCIALQGIFPSPN